jgi:hypothetical protein
MVTEAKMGGVCTPSLANTEPQLLEEIGFGGSRYSHATRLKSLENRGSKTLRLVARRNRCQGQCLSKRQVIEDWNALLA